MIAFPICLWLSGYMADFFSTIQGHEDHEGLIFILLMLKLRKNLDFFLSKMHICCNDDVNTWLSIQEKIMAKTAIIQTRVDPKTKESAQTILKKLNISMSEAISMYLSQIALHNGIPFELKIPNELTAKTLRDSENGDNLHKTESVDALFEELDS